LVDFSQSRTKSLKAKCEREEKSAKETPNPPTLSPKIPVWMVALIRMRVKDKNPIRSVELLDKLYYHVDVMLTSDALEHFVRNMSALRSLGTREHSTIPWQFRFMGHENGCYDSPDRREFYGLVPIDVSDASVFVS
jgi:hypothetical protein